MSGFKALNVDSESEEEVDDTKEIQLEEAFKLYQNALKLHSQGPSYYDEANSAYNELFKSEIFKYPEGLSEFASDLLDDQAAPVPVRPEPEVVPVLANNAPDSAANALPHIIYLAYKNKAQFTVDAVQHRFPTTASHQALSEDLRRSCESGLSDFAEALERDDTDIDLWKKAARVADVLSRQRISRFCLESVLAGDDDGTEQTIDLSGLDEAFAAGELEQVVTILQDDLSKARAPEITPKQQLLTLLRQSNDAYPGLPKRPEGLEYPDPRFRPNQFPVTSTELRSESMSGLGGELLHLIRNSQKKDGIASAQDILTIDQLELQQSPSELDKDVFVDASEEVYEHQNPVLTSEANDAQEVSTSSGQVKDSNEPSTALQEGAKTVADSAPGGTTHLPTRKRSSTAAGNDEPEGRLKSKRIRARESILEVPTQDEEVPLEPPSHQSWHWTVLKNADHDALKVVDTFMGRLELPLFGSPEQIMADSEPIQGDLPDSGNDLSQVRKLLASDLADCLRNWSDEHSQAVLSGHGNQELVEKSTGVALFMQHLKTAPEENVQSSSNIGVLARINFASSISSNPTTLYEGTFLWFLELLTSPDQSIQPSKSSYLQEAWSEELKQTVVQMLVEADEQMYSLVVQYYHGLAPTSSVDGDSGSIFSQQHWLSRLTELVQTIFELHLDIHSRITNPSSRVDQIIRLKQLDRLERWAALTDDFVRLYSSRDDARKTPDGLIVRFLWASAMYAGQADNVDQAHIMLCLQDLEHILEKFRLDPISLPNNAIMPAISVEAAEQQIFRLSTLDFFMSVFDTDNSDPVAVIEKLEPLLEYGLNSDAKPQALPPAEAEKLVQFLDSGDASLRLFMWRRLQNAYTSISYTPKVVSCLLRAAEAIFDYFKSPKYAATENRVRQLSTLKWLKDVDDVLAKLLPKLSSDANALECLDTAHVKSSLTAISFFLRLLHGFALFEDRVRFGHTSLPPLKGASLTKQHDKSKERLREMQARLWTIQYLLLKEAAAQNTELFNEKDNDLADYLCTVHHALGQRHYCKYANKQFVRLVKSELGALSVTNDYTGDMAQVLFDLYQMRFKVAEGDFDHGCPSETLDKKTAVTLIPIVMVYARRMNIKDLIKSELKNAIDKIQSASGTVKSPPAVLTNRKLMTAFLRSAVIPEDLYRSIKGLGDLPTRPVIDDTSVKATHGWYFLLGHMALAKYRSVKRTTPTPTEDLDQAVTLLRQDLEHDMEKWETWFRLAQVYEAKIEDDLMWNSIKLNDARGDIAQLERSAIHAFTMATTVAMRSADNEPEIAQKIAELFHDFAHRLYASSRPPMNMEAFRTDKIMRHLSNSIDQSMSKVPFHLPMSMCNIWSLAAYLLQRKVSDKPKPWTAYYTLSKCLWKIMKSTENSMSRHPVTAQQVLEACANAVDALPRKEKSTDPILEPHLKLTSIVHKMVYSKTLSPQQGFEALQVSRFAHNVPLVEDEEGADWERYVLRILENLKKADKSNWHHRIISRAAHVIYDSDPSVAGALGAKHEFTQQIFTKTMTYQVWKPEHERPGRHYVFTGQYVLFFAHLLDQLNDRANLDQLVRRVRRKYTDFIDHTRIWESLATLYVRLLRRLGKIVLGKERELFDSIPYDEFVRNSEKLEKWALEEDTTSIFLDIIRDGVDLKKLNNSLVKGGLIDDLIGDAYACMYQAFVAQLPPEEQHLPQPPPQQSLPQGTFINMTTDSIGPDGSHQNVLPSGDTSEHGSESNVGLGPQTPGHQFIGAPQQPPVDTARPVPPNKPGRAKTITRREVQRKAEGVLTKPPPIKTPTLMKRPVIEITMTPSKERDVDTPGPDNEDTDMLDDNDKTRKQRAHESRTSSRRSSIHSGGDAAEEADDESESELSRLDEEDEGEGSEAPPRPRLFPNILQHDQDENESDADDDEDADEIERQQTGSPLGDGMDLDAGPESETDLADKQNGEGAAEAGEGELEIQDSQERRQQGLS